MRGEERKFLVREYKRAIDQCTQYKSKDDMWLLKRLYAAQFIRAVMGPGAVEAYQEFRGQIDAGPRYAGRNRKIVVPKNIRRHDAMQALQLIRLECDPTWNFHATWEEQPGREDVLKGRDPREFGR